MLLPCFGIKTLTHQNDVYMKTTEYIWKIKIRAKTGIKDVNIFAHTSRAES